MTVYISDDVVFAAHEEQLAEHGGAVGIRDENALLSALNRPKQLEAYGEPPPDLADLAGAYAFGLARNHGFVDGNKRTSLVITELFLDLNGMELVEGDKEVLDTWRSLGAGNLTEAEIAAWIRERMVPKP